MQRFIYLLFFGILSLQVNAQNYHINYEHITTKQGLSNNFVNHIIQDKEGFIWIATQDGLNRYDGYNFEVFKVRHHQKNSLPSNIINFLEEDIEGNIWIGTEKGLAKWDRLSQKFETFTPFKNQKITYIYQDSRHTIWVSTYHKILYLKKGSQEWKQSMKVSTNAGTPLFGYIGEHLIKKRKELFMIRFASVGNNVFYQYLYILNRKTKKWRKILKVPYHTLYISPQKQVFFINKPKQTRTEYRKEHIRLYDPTFSIKHIIVPQNENMRQAAFDGVMQKNDRMLITDVEGLLEIDMKRERIIRFWNAKLFDKNIEKYGINSMLIDNGRNLWIYGMGITIIPKNALDNPKTYRFEENKQSPLGGSSVRSIYQDNLGYIWTGTYHKTGNPLDVFDNKQKSSINLKETTVISKIMPDPINKNILWAISNGLHKIDKQKRRHLKTYERKIYPYYSLYPVSDTEIWFASVDSLYHFNPKTNQTINSYLIDGTNHIWVDNEQVWLATRSKGIALLNQETGKIKYFSYQENNPKSITSNNVKSIYKDKKGRFWVGTALGLNLFDRQTKTFTYFTEKDGLPNNMVYGILEDKKGNLWLSTNKGISKFNPQTKEFTNFDDKDGLQDNEFNTNAFFKNEKTGEMFFGGINGITSFFPEKMKKNTFVPPIVLTNFRRKGKVVNLGKPISEIKKLTMNYDEAQSLTFEFVALNFFQSYKNQYAYKIEELHEDWINLGTKHELTLTSLNTGTYILCIKGSNNHGLWNKKGLKITLIVKPPFWQTWWFRTILLLLFLALVYGIYRWRVYQVRKREVFLEKQVKNRTEEVQTQAEALEKLNQTKDRLFSIIAHDLRSPMAAFESITQQLDFYIGQNELEKVKALNQYIKSSSNSINNLLNNLLSWALIQKDAILHQAETLKLKDLIKDILVNYQIRLENYQINLIINISDTFEIYADENALSTILRNLISNAIKFTPQKGRIDINAYDEENFTIVEIKDTGQGMSQEKAKNLFKVSNIRKSKGLRGEKGTGLGLVLVGEFMEMHQGHIQVLSEEDKGTSIILKFPKKVIIEALNDGIKQ